MTRDQIEAEYRVVNGLIVSRGKFQGEPVYAPHFHELVQLGGADATEPLSGGNGDPDDMTYVFEIDASDVEAFVELQNVTTLRLWEDEHGFVHTRRETIEGRP